MLVLSEMFRFIEKVGCGCYNSHCLNRIGRNYQMKLNVKSANKEEKEIVKEFDSYMNVFSKNLDECLDIVLEKGDKQGYTISVAERGGKIEYSTYPTLCRALLFLAAEKQIVAGRKIHENCAFEDFGIMLDISRNAVLKINTLKEMIFYAACMGYQFVGLYMEDTLSVKEEPYFGYMRGRMKPEEIKEADLYALKFGIELRPYIQTLAHLNQITRYEEYQKIIDTKDILLVKEKRTEKLLDHILKNVSEYFTSKNINIGMDEAELIGAGKYMNKHGFEEKRMIMQSHLNTVLDLCRKYDLRPQMWSDMFVHLFEKNNIKSIIPEDLQIFYWDYYSTKEEHYSEMLKKHLEFTKRVGFAGGAWKWTGFVPHNGYSIQIGKASMNACKKNGIHSYTVTCWGDDGAEASCFSVLPSLYQDASEAYESKMNESAFELMTGYTLKEFFNIDLVNPYSENQKIHNNSSKYLFYNDPLIGTFDSVLKKDAGHRFACMELEMKSLAKKSEFGYLFLTMQRLCAVLKKKADMGIRVKAAYDRDDYTELKRIAEEEIPETLLNIDKFYEAFQSQWKKENKSFGFEIQTIRFGGLILRLKDIKRQLEKYVSGELNSIEELDEERLPFRYFEKNEMQELNYNLWSDIVSPSVIG